MSAAKASTPGRPRMPWDDEITLADRLVDQGVGNYYEVRQKLGDKALTVVGTTKPAPKSASVDLMEYYGTGHNFKHGELGGAWVDPTPVQAAVNAQGLRQVRAELEAARARREAS